MNVDQIRKELAKTLDPIEKDFYEGLLIDAYFEAKEQEHNALEVLNGKKR